MVGKIAVARRWWSSPTDGSYAPVDAFIDPNHDTVSVGVREMAARLNNGQRGFATVAANLEGTAAEEGAAEAEAVRETPASAAAAEEGLGVRVSRVQGGGVS